VSSLLCPLGYERRMTDIDKHQLHHHLVGARDACGDFIPTLTWQFRVLRAPFVNIMTNL
jgi:hypothetical protein